MASKFRVKNHAELIASGFGQTPAGSYVHSSAQPLTQAMMDYAQGFDDAVIECIMNSYDMFIDHFVFSPAHFTEVLPRETPLETGVIPLETWFKKGTQS